MLRSCVGDIAEEGLIAGAVAEHGVTRTIHLAALQIPFVAADPVCGALVNDVGTVRGRRRRGVRPRRPRRRRRRARLQSPPLGRRRRPPRLRERGRLAGARGLITYGEAPIPIEPELDADGLPALVGALPSTDLSVAVQKTIEHFDGLRKAGRLEASEIPRS